MTEDEIFAIHRKASDLLFTYGPGVRSYFLHSYNYYYSIDGFVEDSLATSLARDAIALYYRGTIHD